MDLNVPDFLGPPERKQKSRGSPHFQAFLPHPDLSYSPRAFGSSDFGRGLGEAETSREASIKDAMYGGGGRKLDFGRLSEPDSGAPDLAAGDLAVSHEIGSNNFGRAANYGEIGASEYGEFGARDFKSPWGEVRGDLLREFRGRGASVGFWGEPLETPRAKWREPPRDMPRFDPFALPAELQGGVGTILSRRPSYAAESFTRNMAGFSAQQLDQACALLQRFSVGDQEEGQGNWNDETDHSRSQNQSNSQNQNQMQHQNQNLQHHNQNHNQIHNQIQNQNHNQNHSQHQNEIQNQNHNQNHNLHNQNHNQIQNQNRQFPKPEYPPARPRNPEDQTIADGLLLRDQCIEASPDLRTLYGRAAPYFQDRALTREIVARLNRLLARPAVAQLVAFLRRTNSLAPHRALCLVANKNGKLDLLAYPSHSNIRFHTDDLAIVDGDRGKDLAMVVDPHINVDLAVLFNYVKKIEHLKSLTIVDGKKSHLLHEPAAQIVARGEDSELTISLPTKQVLRLASPKEVHRLGSRFLEERRAFVTCHTKIADLALDGALSLVDVEYQFDFKKLIFYYFANFRRVDFRGLIKELFKIYKTRIWLCAVLPADQPDLYIAPDGQQRRSDFCPPSPIPPEYEPAPKLVPQFSVGNFELFVGSYFHLRNLMNLLTYVEQAADGYFYGFNAI